MVLLAYGAGAWVIVLAADWFRRAFALPGIFETLLYGGLILGAPLAAMMAWRYPDLGNDGVPAADRNGRPPAD